MISGKKSVKNGQVADHSHMFGVFSSHPSRFVFLAMAYFMAQTWPKLWPVSGGSLGLRTCHSFAHRRPCQGLQRTLWRRSATGREGKSTPGELVWRRFLAPQLICSIRSRSAGLISIFKLEIININSNHTNRYLLCNMFFYPCSWPPLWIGPRWAVPSWVFQLLQCSFLRKAKGLPSLQQLIALLTPFRSFFRFWKKPEVWGCSSAKRSSIKVFPLPCRSLDCTSNCHPRWTSSTFC